jgi:hypothetical protein
MKIVISAGGKKRAIIGPYAICAGSMELRRLRDAIDNVLVNPNFYGWIDVVEKAPHVIDSTPEPWILS